MTRICGNPQWSEEWDKLGLRRSGYEQSLIMWWLKYETCDIMVSLYPCTPCILIITQPQPQQGTRKKMWKTFKKLFLRIIVKCPLLTVTRGWVTIDSRARPGQLLIVRLNCVDNKLLTNIIYHTNSISSLLGPSQHFKCSDIDNFLISLYLPSFTFNKHYAFTVFFASGLHCWQYRVDI